MDDLVQLNSRGLIPGPEETEKNFYARCERAVQQAKILDSRMVEETYGVAPDWVSVVYSNKNLHFWEGGCTWIEKDQITLQLKKTFQRKKIYLGIYSRDELVAHELVHVVRQEFEEPIFEEILAYHLSKSPLRRLLGPVFRSSKEVFVFFGALIAPFFTLYAYPFLVGVLGFGLWRLMYSRSIFQKTRRKLSKLVGKQNALAVMLRLTDGEIMRFAKMSCVQISQYAEKSHPTSLRWKQLILSYTFT